MVLTTASWDQHRYLAAADFARQAREASLPAEVRARLGVLVAEAYFRAGQEGGGPEDFREAAAAYAAALNAPPGAAGGLMFQRIKAEILAGSLEGAQAALDELEHNPGFDQNSRWEAEWSLARALQLQGKVETALRRITAVLATPAPGVNSELRARMQWLQAQVSFDAGEYDRTLTLADALIRNLAGLESALWKTEIAGNAQLLRVQAYFSLGREPEAQAALSQLRAEARESPADVESYLIEADHYAKQGQIVVALQTLRKLADQFPKSDEAPYALLESAYLAADRLGQEKNLDQANTLLKELINNYPRSEWVPDAYLKEGAVLRELNRFPEAQSTYEHLINFLPNNPDAIQAKLALADCHRAQAGLSPDSTHLESARSLYEEILDRASAAADIRVEAGYKLGLILKERSVGDAQKVWFLYVVDAFLLSPQAPELGSRGDFWMTQTLLGLGALFREQGKLDEAQKVWRLIIEHRLPGAQHLAQGYLDALASGSPKP